MTNPSGNFGSGIDPGALGGLGAAGVIPAAGGIIDTFVNAQTARRNTDKTIEAQRREAELAYQRSIAMWHMQNAYNSPAEQMKRFGAAGLNPHLIYGQGNSGNASGMPQYQAPNLQYRYAAPAYGGAVASIIPTLMAVGTWMQNMKLSEVEIEAKKTNVEKAEQLIEYLNQRNPKEIQALENKLSLFPYQKDAQQYATELTGWKVSDMIAEFQHRHGRFGSDDGGLRRQQLLEAAAKAKLAGAKASFSDFSITDPQALMQLVLSGVMGMAGQQMRMRPSVNPKARRVKTFYQDGKRRSQVVDYD